MHPSIGGLSPALVGRDLSDPATARAVRANAATGAIHNFAEKDALRTLGTTFFGQGQVGERAFAAFAQNMVQWRAFGDQRAYGMMMQAATRHFERGGYSPRDAELKASGVVAQASADPTFGKLIANAYAREALHQWYRLLYRGKLASTSLVDFVEMTGVKLLDDNGGGLLDRLPPIHRWLNRLLALRIETQNAIFEEYMALIQARIDEARDAGRLDVGVETIMTERTVLLDEQILRRDPVTGAQTKLSRLELHYRRRVTSLPRLLKQWQGVPITFLRNGRSGRVALQVPSWGSMDSEGNIVTIWALMEAILLHLRTHDDEQVWTWYEFAFGTGLRPSEQIAVQWSDVDWKRRTVRIQRARVRAVMKSTKTALVRDVDLTDRMIAVLARQKAHSFERGPGSPIFINPVTGMPWPDVQDQRKLYFHPALRALGLRVREAYQTRHTYATLALMAGVNPAYIARQLGHVNAAMLFKHYAKWIDGADSGREAAKLNALFAR